MPNLLEPQSQLYGMRIVGKLPNIILQVSARQRQLEVKGQGHSIHIGKIGKTGMLRRRRRRRHRLGLIGTLLTSKNVWSSYAGPSPIGLTRRVEEHADQ